MSEKSKKEFLHEIKYNDILPHLRFFVFLEQYPLLLHFPGEREPIETLHTSPHFFPLHAEKN